MKTKVIFALVLLVMSGALAPSPAKAETFPMNFEIGYRWLHNTGNDLMYRTQINERSGLLIRTLYVATPELRIDATDLGVGPASALRLQSSREGAYKLSVAYRSHNSFSALPTFSNPLLSQGVFLSQHTYDRTRRMVDADLEFVPDRSIAPFVGFSYGSNNGPEHTTYTIGQDEFLLQQNLRENDRELRAGASFKFSKVYGSLTQGWRTFHSTESYALPGTSTGNNTNPILGQGTSADTILRNDVTRVKTPFTNAFVTTELGSRLTVVGNYVRFAADSTGSENESATGTFTSFEINRFFTGLSETASSRAKNTTWRGGARAEFNLYKDIDLLAAYQKEHRDLTGSALLDTLFLNSTTFDKNDLRDVQKIIDAANSMSRNEAVTSVGLSARSLGPVSFRTEFRSTKQTVEAAPDVAEIVVPGNQGGTFDRTIKTLDSTLSYSQYGWLLSANWRNDNADQAIFRTDYLDRNRLRLRAMWKAPKYVRFGITSDVTKQTNDQPDVLLNASVHQYIGDVEVTPLSWLGLRGSYAKFRANSDALYRVPQNFTTADSRRFENGYSREGGVAVTRDKWSFDTGLSKFKNAGTTPFTVDHYHARFTIDLKSRTGLAAEWNRDKYNDLLGVSDFSANRYGIYLRFIP